MKVWSMGKKDSEINYVRTSISITKGQARFLKWVEETQNGLKLSLSAVCHKYLDDMMMQFHYSESTQTSNVIPPITDVEPEKGDKKKEKKKKQEKNKS